MSEYWVSHKKYFCRYCEIYIADDAPSRRLHENGLRHKGNTERFIRALYKSGEKKKKELDEEKREMVRVEQASSLLTNLSFAVANRIVFRLLKPLLHKMLVQESPSQFPKALL
jgi:U1 zinc finger